ncbi:GHKL domain-containing protein [Lysinibacillus sp. NPDC097231]|uniref:sensor histidine kinase n=1 Tax=Lysinibacillus sp. NPDC097231 TaxID=3364142 RepID=UPI0037F879DB
MSVLLDILTLWLITCLFFREPLKFKWGHVLWVSVILLFCLLGDSNERGLIMTLKGLGVLPVQNLPGLIGFCFLTLVANSYLFKRSHLTILLMTMLSLMIWIMIRMQAVLLTMILPLDIAWNHFINLALVLCLVFFIRRYFAYTQFEQMTLMQQLFMSIFFFAFMGIYLFQTTEITQFGSWFMLLGSIFVFLLISLLFFEQKKQQAMQARILATEKYLPIIDELVLEVRARQHEFSNKMLAITSILETADTLEEARHDITRYTGNVKLQSHQQQLLTMDHKIVAGFLYTKIKRAEQMGIQVVINNSISVHDMPCEDVDLIEVLGILLDNAFDASQSGDTVYVTLKKEENQYVLQVSNPSPYISNEHFLKMFDIGFSTKKGVRGFGLHNVQQIAKQYKANILLVNEQKTKNYVTIGLQFQE